MATYGREIHANCEVILHPNQAGFFKAGDEINGKVVLTVDKPTLFYGCKVILEGWVVVRFKFGSETHRETKQILQESQFLIGDGTTGILIPPPSVTHQFSFRLSSTSQFLGSYSNPNGSIIYQVVAYVHNSRRLIKKGEKTINVKPQCIFPPSSLSILPGVLEGSSSGLGSPTFNFTIPGGVVYMGGDNIQFQLNVSTVGSRECYSGRVALCKRTTFHAGPSKTTREVVGTPAVEEFNNSFTGNLNIPADTRPTHKGLIEVRYFAVVAIKEKGKEMLIFKSDLEILICTLRNLPTPSSPEDGRRRTSFMNVMERGIDSQLQLSEDPPSYSSLNLTNINFRRKLATIIR